MLLSIIYSFIQLISSCKMVEVMFEQSREYFIKYQKNYRFFLSELLPTEMLKTDTAMAYSLHEGNDSSHLFAIYQKKDIIMF